ncbi:MULTISPECIES: hypothetical protein [Streptomyces]|uniref:LPXTG cell wall anchor domain-containing protein n=1 Tax=Streptomyces xanthochromogenes TaxID=67384 RepID=A0ABQ3AZ29_9ACTN|nr:MULTISPECIES: hypothetical protein [Streptomyces]MYV92122.1 hypothetical protein [Streptomyces sp. SID1034]GGY70323.1 hypothetical protein GCM10010326_75760 [Streptomyces xanthochromogenes]GHB78735.1 hypothetical protein GCM10010331_78060 [Streptomyces xanthochromogenes]
MGVAQGDAVAPEPASRAADRGDPMLDVVAVSAAALASAGGLLLARRKR